MSNTYIKPEERKTILLISDDLRVTSGVGVMSRAIVYRTAEHFNWIQIGILTKHNTELLKEIDISNEVNLEMGYKDASVKIYPDILYNNQFSNLNNLRKILSLNKIDGILFFTDPRYYYWLFESELEIRQRIPLIYLNIWDNLPYPLWNKPFYESCDGLFAISKQTYNINVQLIQDSIDEKVVKYIPHGIENTYYPMNPSSPQLDEYKRKVFGNDIPKFILLFNARNMNRKNMGDLVLGWKLFTDTLSDKDAVSCCLLMHCNPSSWDGTDIEAIWKDNSNTDRCKVKFLDYNMSFAEMNLMYNISDGVILPSYAEGWGLSITEAMMTGKMFIATVTGGMQDQMRFEDENGNWITFSKDFPTNSIGKYKKHGDWCIPIFPITARSNGSPKNPYIYEDVIRIQDIADAITKLYNIPKEKRIKLGDHGYQWATGEEAGFTASIMGERVVDGIEEVLNKFKPQNNYRIIKISPMENKINQDIIWRN